MSARIFSTMLTKPEGADVRLADEEDLFGSASLHKLR